MFRKLVFAAVCLTFAVVIVGSYVRLQDAGLGCPDWPGCYGRWVGVPGEAHEVERAAQAFPGRPVETRKAWKELFHRYLAGTLGVLLLAIMVTSWLQRRALRQSPLLPTAIVALVALQATLGMWTVTLLLKPMIVTLHLLVGMATLGLLTWLALRQIALPPAGAGAQRLRPWAALGIVIVVCQIALGGWVAANYAALACPDFPTCHGVWLPDMDFRHGFQFVRELGMTAAGYAACIRGAHGHPLDAPCRRASHFPIYRCVCRSADTHAGVHAPWRGACAVAANADWPRHRQCTAEFAVAGRGRA